MMERKKVLLQGVFDYLIFFKNGIKVTHENSIVDGVILDRANEVLSIKIPPFSYLDLEKQKSDTRFQLSCLYKGMCLHFEATLEAVRKEGVFNILQCIVTATHGVLTDVRSRPRYSIDDDTLHVALIVQSPQRKTRCIQARLLDFSSDSMSILLAHENTRVLPGENVSFTVLKKELPILTGSGEIVRDVDVKAELETHQQIVIVFDKQDKISDDSRSRRISDRVFLLDDNPGFVYFEHPFQNEHHISGKIVDLSNHGVSILCEEEHALPRGLCIIDAEVQLPLLPSMKTELKVSECSLFGTEDKVIYRVGFEFSKPTPMLWKHVSSFVQKNVSPYLFDATAEDCDPLWAFFFESRFIYGAKRQQLQANAERVLETYKKLLYADPPIFKKILYKQDGEIKGHIVAVRVFDETFIIQHLAASKVGGSSAGQAVIRGITSFFLDAALNHSMHTRYVCAYYRPSNLYPSLVFGETENLIGNPSICSTRIYRFCILSSQELEDTSNITSCEASDRDLRDLEAILIESREFQLMRVEGLGHDKITSLALTSEYEKIGLYRYRRVFVAKQGKHRVYAVCNYASPGINLSELTNAVKFFYSFDSSPATKQALANALSAKIIESYQTTDVSDMVLLLSPDQPVPAGFKVEKQYTMWILNTDYVSKFREATEYIFRNIRDYVKKHRSAEKTY